MVDFGRGLLSFSIRSNSSLGECFTSTSSQWRHTGMAFPPLCSSHLVEQVFFFSYYTLAYVVPFTFTIRLPLDNHSAGWYKRSQWGTELGNKDDGTHNFQCPKPSAKGAVDGFFISSLCVFARAHICYGTKRRRNETVYVQWGINRTFKENKTQDGRDSLWIQINSGGFLLRLNKKAR